MHIKYSSLWQWHHRYILENHSRYFDLGGTKLKWYILCQTSGPQIKLLSEIHTLYQMLQRIKQLYTNQMLTEFSFARPSSKCDMLKIYGCSFHDSPLWDLHSADKTASTLLGMWHLELCVKWYKEHTPVT